MPVFRTEKTSGYAVISKHHLKNRTLSYKAKGLMTFMLSVPDDWDWSLAGLATLSSDGIDGVRSGIRELEKHGYLTRRRIRDAGGRLGDIEYTIHELPKIVQSDEPDLPPRVQSSEPHAPTPDSPKLENPMLDSPKLKSPTLESPTLENPTLDLPILDNPTLEKPTQVLPTQENPTQLNNKELNNKELNNKKEKHVCAQTENDNPDAAVQLSLDDGAFSQSQQAGRLTVKTAGGQTVAQAMTLVEQQFELFWQQYPRKAGKKAAKKAWMGIKPDAELLGTIMSAIGNAVRYWAHQGVAQKHIPHPSTWLSEERWEDEFPAVHMPGGTDTAAGESKGGVQTATTGADYTIGGDDDPYRAIMPGYGHRHE